MEVDSLKKENHRYGGGQFNGRYRGGHFNKSHVTEAVSLMEGEGSCYRGGQLNAGRMVMLGGQVYIVWFKHILFMTEHA